ncbi:MAG: polyphosphate kinase 1 [Chloroflexota bacterium]
MTTIQTISSSDIQSPNLYDPALYINRELSWLEFNERCLSEALDPTMPLLERVRFLAIFSNNLDEFYMVRVSGLKDQVTAGVVDTPSDGLTPQQQLNAIRERVLPMKIEQRRVFHDELVPKLAENGIHVLSYDRLSEEDRRMLRRYFETEVYPVLTPLAVDPGRPFPHISNLSLNLAVMIEDEEGNEHFARVKVPSVLPRLIALNDVLRLERREVDPHIHRLVWLEEMITANLDLLFPGMKVTAASAFRITRNNDMEIAEEEASDLLETIEKSVQQRRFGQVVLMTAVDTMPEPIRAILMENLEIEPEDIFTLRAPLGMSDLFLLANIEMPQLKAPLYIPQQPSAFSPGEDIFTAIRRQDILIHRPYDSFIPVLEFFEQAAEDPQVLAIKATLYRTGSNSQIIQSLLRAQENSKQVAVLVELKARFDEENNIGWARTLEGSGVHVVRGVPGGLKTHAKIALVVRKEGDGIRRYVHLSTGNYNASTARIYTDLCMFTCRDDIAADASELFNRLTAGYSNHIVDRNYRKLLIAPEHLRKQLTALIEREIDHARAGRKAHLIFKMNSLVDAEMIRLLYTASIAGVQIDLLVRGICGLRPGIPGISDNIRVTCLIGRFLEHSRIYYFNNNGNPDVYLGSADLMPRNLNNRVEAMFPVESTALKQRLIDEILAIEMADNVRARELLSDGSYQRLSPAPGQAAIDSQRWFMEHSRDH